MTKFTELKKTVAGVLAFAMAFSPMVTTFAATQSDPATGSVSSNGTTEGIVDTNVFAAVLPTISGNQLSFKLDPQGLLTVSGNDAKYANVSAGDIVFTNKVSSDEVSVSANLNQSNVIYATNKSTYDVTFSVDVSMSNTDDEATAVTFVSTNDAVSQGTDRNIYFAAVPEQNYISYNRVSGNNFKAISSNAATDYAQVLDEDGTASLAFLVSGNDANYYKKLTVSGNGDKVYSYEIDETKTDWQTVGFTMTGLCNPNADWAAFDAAKEDLELDLAWTMTKADSTEAYSTDSDCPDGLVKITTVTIDSTKVGYNTTSKSFWITVPGVSTVELAKVSNFAVTPAGGSATAIANDKLTATNASVCVTWANLSAAGLSWPTGSYYVFTFTYDGTNYRVVYTAA